MDPDEALRKAQELVVAIIHDEKPTEENANALAEAFSALDGWLSAGGFLPRAWRR
jgi:hypothetical protein